MSVSVEDKKKFIAWLLKTHKLVKRECVWILNYMLSTNKLLENVHFTENVAHCDFGAVMKTEGCQGVDFRYYKGTLMSIDPEKLFHELRLNMAERFYLEINFPKEHKCRAEYLAVLEENPYLPINNMDGVDIEAKAIIDKLEIENIKNEIDNALDKNDQELFFTLCQMKYEKEQEIEAASNHLL